MAEHAAREGKAGRPPARTPPPTGMTHGAPTHSAGGLNDRPAVVALKALGERLSGRAAPHPIQREATAPNRTGLPDQLKHGVEALSGIAMDDVRVHRNSARPSQLQAHAFAQGSDIHLAPGQEEHLPHEAWHVVQQKQGRVRATTQLKGSVAANTDSGLEREADRMGARALGTRPGDAPALLAHAASGSAPVQCQMWKWVLTPAPPHWEQTGGSISTSPPPKHLGTWDGELYDDAGYSQATDKTVTPFLSPGENFLGESAADKQRSGKTPTANDIRVKAFKGPGLVRGSGLHEVVPTNLGAKVAKSGNKALIGAQSGFRTSTGKQLFNIPGGDVGAHTGFSPKPGSRGYSHTKGQAPAHDKMRDTTDDIITNKIVDRDEVVNALLLQHLDVTPHGQAILASPYLDGMTPNNHHNLGPVGPVNPNGPPDPQRLLVAQEAHQERERVKKRGRTQKRATSERPKKKKLRTQSPSPPREPIDNKGQGGGYIQNPTIDDEIEAFPFVPDQGDDFEYAANVSGWMSQPGRFQ